MKQIKTLVVVLLAVATATVVQGSYVITTPRRWILGETTKVCVHHIGASAQVGDHLAVTLRNNQDTTITAPAVFHITPSTVSKCYQVILSKDGGTPPSSFGNTITFEGKLGEDVISDTRQLSVTVSEEKTFLQTDKFLYRPGQLVRFRILTIQGNEALPSMENYPAVYVETPSKTRIQQWLNVDSSKGLVHLEFELNQEVEEGTYKIIVQTTKGEETHRTFKVEDYVPPKFEVTITGPKSLLSTDSGGSFRVCAKYTFGQPVKGKATIIFSRQQEITKHNRISGCQDFAFTFEEFGDLAHSRRSVEVEASVEEEGTGVVLKSSKERINVHNKVFDFEMINQKPFAKPGLPTVIRVKATRKKDGKAAAHEPMKVCLTQHSPEKVCKDFMTDVKGVLSFQVPYSALDGESRRTLEITALNYPEVKNERRLLVEESKYSINTETFFSPSNSSLLLWTPFEENLDCKKGEQHLIHLDLLFAAFRQRKANITVQVISRGDIWYQHTAEYTLASSSLPIDLEYLKPMEEPSEGVVVGAIKIPVSLKEPESKVVVWYSRDDGEVVSDVTRLIFRDCLANQVGMAWDVAQAEPGQRATLTLAAEPNSLCSYGVVDKSVELLSRTKDPLTIKQILDPIRKSNQLEKTFPQQNDDTYCRKKGRDRSTESGSRSSTVRFSYVYTSFHRDALFVFDESGIFFITDLTTETRPCQERKDFIFSIRTIGFDAGGAILRFPSVAAGSASSSGSFGSTFPGVVTVQNEEQESPRSYFPETWLWDLNIVPATGRSLKDFTLPDTVTEWVGRAVCVHPQRGVGLSGESSITTFTPFFAELTLPPSIKRGEVLPVKISVFNYLERGLPVKTVLASSPEYDILDGEGRGERSACVSSNEKVTHTIRIKPKVIGDVNLTVNAFVDPSIPQPCGSTRITKRDSLIQPLRVEAEGFPREETWGKYICTKDLESNEDSLEVWHLEPPAGAVEGSQRAFVTANGDLLGPSLDNLEHLVRMPSGCGEQNMILFTPNIYALQYFEATNQVRYPIVKKSKQYMEKGYQRELTFRHRDGSYSAFGQRDPSGSTWLTAFVVKSFAQARQFIFIDENDLAVSIAWLKRQQMNSGCFKSVGKVLHKSMKGGLAGDSSSDAPLTAYVLMALLEGGESPTSSVVRNAIECLLHQEKTWTTYTRAITSYALALAEHNEARRVLQQLLQEATQSFPSFSWEVPSGTSKGQGKGVAVETAGYAILAMVTLDRTGFSNEALKAVKGVSSERNGQGGFVSTQDTVVALQALAAYSGAVYERDIAVTVNVQAQNLQHTFVINELNRTVSQFAMLPTLPTEVSLDMTGKGCVVIQAVLRYNVPDSDPADAFSLRVETRAAADRGCNTKRIEVCATYLLPDLASNMAILEVNLVSGYVPVKEDLKKVVSESRLFKRFEVDGNSVSLYIDELSSQELCASFKVKRELEVENAKPGTVRIFDYYQPELVVEKSYVLPSASQC